MSVGSSCEWIELRTAEGKAYYFHKESSTVQWEKPTDDLVRIQADLKMLIDLRVHETYESSPGVNEDSKIYVILVLF